MSNQCPNCHHHELEGALFCGECGTKLVEQSGLSTAQIPAVESPQEPVNPDIPHSPPPPTATIESPISLHIVDTGQSIPLVGRQEFTIGRISEGQAILPDVDLTPYEAYDRGVSRLHATVKLYPERFSITDLGSSNGTRLNNQKIAPHQEEFLSHGDIITLGKFKIQTLIRQEEE
ncbi:MAG: FHA domain-containing protein [Anaerolineae bacterium]|nr:FHA domain-containing protein [Anaerolineae bacterium]